MDSALPSGNAVAALVLLRLFSLTGRQLYYDERAKEWELPLAAGKVAAGGRPSTYVCHRQTGSPPVSDGEPLTSLF